MFMTENIPNDSHTKNTAILLIILTTYFIIVLDIFIVITALPEIHQTLGFSHTGLSWVQNAYTLSFGGLLLLGARAGDLLGRKRMFLIGLALFTFASLIVGLAQTPEWLLIARALQGIGAAILAPSTLALLSTHFPEGQARIRALAYYAAVIGISSSLGLVIGGFFTAWLSWRMGFFINIPIGLVLLFAAQKILVETEKHSGKFDLLGAFTSTVGMTALVFGIEHSASHGWHNMLTFSMVAIGLVFITLFILQEARAPQPLLPLRLFASRERVGGYLGRMLFLGTMVSFFFFATQFLQGVLGFSPLEAGAAFLPVTIPTLIASTLVPKLSRSLGNSGVLLLALVCMVFGMYGLTQINAYTDYFSGIFWPMILIGFGNGAALAPLTVAAVSGVAHKDAGAASGLVNVAHQLGASLGLSILVVIFAAASTPLLQGKELLAHQLSSSFEGCLVMLVLAVLVVLTLNIWPNLSSKWQTQRLVAAEQED